MALDISARILLAHEIGRHLNTSTLQHLLRVPEDHFFQMSWMTSSPRASVDCDIKDYCERDANDVKMASHSRDSVSSRKADSQSRKARVSSTEGFLHQAILSVSIYLVLQPCAVPIRP